MFAAETCSEDSSTNTRPRRDQSELGFRHPHAPLAALCLDDAIDSGELVPGSKGWRQRQREIVEHYLTGADSSGPTPLARIHAPRRNAWLQLHERDGERDLLETARGAIESQPISTADAHAALEPLL